MALRMGTKRAHSNGTFNCDTWRESRWGLHVCDLAPCSRKAVPLSVDSAAPSLDSCAVSLTQQVQTTFVHFVHVYLCVWYACVCWWTCVQRLISGTFFHHSPPQVTLGHWTWSVPILLAWLAAFPKHPLSLPQGDGHRWTFELQSSHVPSKHLIHRKQVFNLGQTDYIFQASGVLVVMIPWGLLPHGNSSQAEHGQTFSIKSSHDLKTLSCSCGERPYSGPRDTSKDQQ